MFKGLWSVNRIERGTVAEDRRRGSRLRSLQESKDDINFELYQECNRGGF